MTANNRGEIYCSIASSPSGAHGEEWEDLGKDGGKAALHFSIRSDIPLDTEIAMPANDINILTSYQFII